jgi:2-oxoglutarate ferredoxin oxidoreductase subunit gamma
MHMELVIAGMGGQGALTAGEVIATAVTRHGKAVTNTPVYTPEVRGGTSNALVVVSDDPIGSMMVDEPTHVVFLCDFSVARIMPCLRPGAKVVYNSTLVDAESLRPTVDALVVGIPATTIASELGDVRCTNVVALGALAAVEPELPIAWLTEAVESLLGKRKQHLVEPNVRALEAGMQAVRVLTPT